LLPLYDYVIMKVRLLFLSLFLAVCSCSAKADAEHKPEFRLEVSSVVLDQGDSYAVEVSTSDDGSVWSAYSFDDNDLGISFASTDTNVVSVSKGGIMKAKLRGRAILKVSSCESGQIAKLSVRVVEEDERALLSSDWDWKDLDRGARCGYTSLTMFDSVQSISLAEYPESDYSTTIAYNTGKDCLTTEGAALKENASIAINGSFFDTSALVSAVTFLYGGEIITTSSSSEATNRSTGAIGIDSNGKLSIFPYVASSVANWSSNFTTALASGPLLLQNGRPMVFKDRDFNNLRHPRSMLGKTAEGKVVLVVVDGRFSGKAAGMTIPEMAKLAQYLELDQAINLDGGGSSALWTLKYGVLNYPSDNGTWDHSGLRRDPTVIIAK